jgi:transposase
MPSMKKKRPHRPRRYSDEEIQEALEYCRKARAEGKSWREVSKDMGIHESVLLRWRKKTRAAGGPGFIPVAVREPKATGGPVLVLPNGWKVEGLKVEELVGILTRVS